MLLHVVELGVYVISFEQETTCSRCLTSTSSPRSSRS